MSNKISMIELFSGIGAQERAIRQLKLPYEVINTCDCDKDAVLSYTAMRWDIEKEMETFEFPSQDKMIEELQAKNLGYDFDKDKHTITKRTSLTKLKQYYIADKLSKNLGDISKVEKLPYTDIATYSFPCTDLSVAGKGEGMVNKCDACGYSWPIDFSSVEETLICPECGAKVFSSTRSGLLGQVQRLLAIAKENGTLPKYLLLENVKNLVGKKFIGQFEEWVKWLDNIGYNTYYQVLNGKKYGIPQNRERIFAISIRKDVDNDGFTFPETITLKNRIKNILEKNVDEKYYLPDERIEKILNSTSQSDKKQQLATDEIKVVGNYMPSGHDASRVVGIDGIAPTVKENHGTVTAIAEPQIIKACQLEGSFDQSGRVYDPEGIAPTIMSNSHGKTSGGYTSPKIIVEEQEYIIYDDYNSHISANQDAINTLTCNCGASAEHNGVKIIEQIIVDDIYNNRDPRIYDKYAPTLRSERTGLKVVDNIEYPCSTRGNQIASTIRASIYKQGARNLEENVVNGLGYEGVIEQETISEEEHTKNKKIRYRIRKLTSKECWRLMNFTDRDHDRAAKYVSASALYKQAGNSIIVACLIALMSSLFIEDGHKAEVWTKYILNFND